MSGGLLGFLGAVLGIREPPSASTSSEVKQRWRNAIHESRNEAMRAVAKNRQSHKTSDQVFQILTETVREQEAQQRTRETTIDQLVREMQGRK